MRGIPTSRPAAMGARESLTPEEFARRAGGDESSRDRAVNQETFLRNEFGVRTFGYTSFVVDPPNGQMPPSRRLPPPGGRPWPTSGRSARARSTLRRLQPVRPLHHARRRRHLPGALRQRPPHRADAERSDDQLRDDSRHARDPARRPPAHRVEHQAVHGRRRGRWEGDTLVVETTNFTDKTSFSGLHSDQLKLTEWFTRIDPQMIDYRIRVEDPATWTAPFTVRLTITQQPNYQLFEYSCHEGNGAVGYALSGERAYERWSRTPRRKGSRFRLARWGWKCIRAVRRRPPARARVRRREVAHEAFFSGDSTRCRTILTPRIAARSAAPPSALLMPEPIPQRRTWR